MYNLKIDHQNGKTARYKISNGFAVVFYILKESFRGIGFLGTFFQLLHTGYNLPFKTLWQFQKSCSKLSWVNCGYYSALIFFSCLASIFILRRFMVQTLKTRRPSVTDSISRSIPLAWWSPAYWWGAYSRLCQSANFTGDWAGWGLSPAGPLAIKVHNRAFFPLESWSQCGAILDQTTGLGESRKSD